MREWGFWEWLGYSPIALAALILAGNAALKDAPVLLAAMPSFFTAAWWSYVPLALVLAGTAILVARAFGWIGP
ncbi:MAG TPA: hypothetical protein VFF44_14615, partial [Casimicrobiaceae bacterium]|nr:hypothetical protein [Casimicrobiaceae bacterium]